MVVLAILRHDRDQPALAPGLQDQAFDLIFACPIASLLAVFGAQIEAFEVAESIIENAVDLAGRRVAAIMARSRTAVAALAGSSRRETEGSCRDRRRGHSPSRRPARCSAATLAASDRAQASSGAAHLRIASVSSSIGSMAAALVTGMRTLNAPHTWRQVKPLSCFVEPGAGRRPLLLGRGYCEGALCVCGGGGGGAAGRRAGWRPAGP